MTDASDCERNGDAARARLGRVSRRAVALAPFALAGVALTGRGNAEPNGISGGRVKLGILTDLSGPYSDITGQGIVVGAQLAIDDMGGAVNGAPIDLLVADHGNKPDVASTIARRWIDEEGLDAFAEVTSSAPALAVLEIARQRNRIIIFNSAGTTRLTNEDCSPVSVHWVYDSYSNAVVTAGSIIKQGGDSWFFLTSDNAFGTALQTDVTAAVVAAGGKIVGAIRQPLGTTDFSSPIIQAHDSGAKVIALANGGADFVNAMKAVQEFQVSRDRTIASLVLLLNDVHAMGLGTAQNLLFTSAWYWDRDDETRAFSKRFFARLGRMPNMLQAGVYSSVRHYLTAVRDSATDDTATVMAKMKATPINDMFAKGGFIREDGTMMHDMYLMQVKTPAESHYEWDYFKQITVVPAAQAFMPLSKSSCPLLRH